ncbi:broad-complex core protein isoforms 1/2/3/4/5-like isoform X2 [Pectinophora gossypiella]|uniref:broad-complex core protein isoforms 1/2/3/4/5-like isoform X2 n=1 Tax=Pectinophora gossypiella TaxID=13191 RepID=UPI00214F421B|nr:broad-complex core protein isoforms 1/2/3/4/5-like isoform X2 [Pectinophora gossypiella]
MSNLPENPLRFGMAPIRYSLHYEDYSEHLMSRFGKLLQMQSLVDMTLMCSSHTLRVHKAVLAASSAYFQEVLQKQTGEPLIILKMRFSVLKCLVEFMYCGKTQCLEENLDELVSAAQFLKIKGLSKVTKEGLGITNHSELPVFTPPVVINRPPQSLIDLHSQDNNDPKPPQPPPQMAPATSTSQPLEGLGRPNKDMVVRIPFDIENGGGGSAGVEYPDAPRAIKPRRGRPSVRRAGGWDSTGALGRAAERALLRREQDSRKAIHQLKHLQSRHMQDYMERVTLSQAVNSICGPESSSAHNYMNIDNDLMYMDQTVSSNVLDPTISYSKEPSMGNETITSSYSTATSNPNDSNTGISTAMSQYVNALKSAGLPTDLPILFESGDGSYINVNEQVLLDMVQSSEIQYEVIEQPNIIEKVADPSEIKSIDDLSKSIERGEMLMGSKGYSSSNYGKDTNQYNRHEDAINSLNSILPDNLESFAEQQNFVVLDPRLQEGNNMDQSNDFSCIDGDMQFFTKSMSDDVKKYYEEQQLNDARVMEQLCPTSTTLDTNFSISLLDTKSSHLNGNMGQQYNPLNSEELRRNEDCYDFGLQLPQTSDFKEDALDCLMSTPKRIEDNQQRAQERDEIIQDLMNIEKNMIQSNEGDKTNFDSNVQDFNDSLNVDAVFNDEGNGMQNELQKNKDSEDLSASISSSGLRWDNMDISSKENENTENDMTGNEMSGNQGEATSDSQFQESVIDLTEPSKVSNEGMDLMDTSDANKENEQIENSGNNLESAVENDIPFAVGLLPLKQVQPTEDTSLLKRKNSIDDLLDNVDAKCLKRKVKYKKL